MNNQRVNRAFQKSIHTLTSGSGATRTETDSLGSKEIPADAYWGINVSRALDNFAISGRPISVYPDLMFGYAYVKQAAARANAEIGVLDQTKADLIDCACEHQIFGSESLPLWIWKWLLLGGVVFFIIVELEKLLVRLVYPQVKQTA